MRRNMRALSHLVLFKMWMTRPRHNKGTSLCLNGCQIKASQRESWLAVRHKGTKSQRPIITSTVQSPAAANGNPRLAYSPVTGWYFDRTHDILLVKGWQLRAYGN
jgi:hypothetical protein